MNEIAKAVAADLLDKADSLLVYYHEGELWQVRPTVLRHYRKLYPDQELDRPGEFLHLVMSHLNMLRFYGA